jgi:hypothetical protein
MVAYVACIVSQQYTKLGLATAACSLVAASLVFVDVPFFLDGSEHGGPITAVAMCLLPVGFTCAVLLGSLSRKAKLRTLTVITISSFCILCFRAVKSVNELASSPHVFAAYLTTIAQNGTGAQIKKFEGRRIQVTGRIASSTDDDGGVPQMGDIAIANLGLFDSFRDGETVTVIGTCRRPIDWAQRGDGSFYVVKLQDCRIERKFAGISFTL